MDYKINDTFSGYSAIYFNISKNDLNLHEKTIANKVGRSKISSITFLSTEDTYLIQKAAKSELCSWWLVSFEDKHFNDFIFMY